MYSECATNNTLHGRTQFSLAAMFEYVTVCSIPLALLHVIGLASGLLLMATALALALRQGFFALLLAMGASLAADARTGPIDSSDSTARQLVIATIIVALACWYKMRRQRLRSELAA